MNVSVIGATGYGGIELIRFLHLHPEVNHISVYSHSSGGKALTDVYPHITGILPETLREIDVQEIAKGSDVVFLATPPGVSSELSPSLLEAGVRVIDLSGDFRLKDPDIYEQWYGRKTASASELQKAVYGLSEWYAEEIASASLIANPGCYPTATLLGLLPLIADHDVRKESLIIDAKTGVSGAGRTPSLTTHFGEVNENVSAYKVASHKHTPEIEQIIGDIGGEETVISFTPHLIPMTRGILSTIYVELKTPEKLEKIQQTYEKYYGDKPFVRLRPLRSYPKTKEVYGSNYCDISLHYDERTRRIIVLSVIDNVVKGAAGQAIQNMNLMFGFPEDAGLQNSPVFP